MEKIYKVSELIETKYLYATTSKDLEYLMSNSVKTLKSGEAFHALSNLQERFIQDVISDKHIPTLDIVDMHLTEGAARLIATYQVDHNLKFIDSSDKGRNRILKMNEVYANSSKYTVVSLPRLDKHVGYVEYIKNLNEEDVYSFSSIEDIDELRAMFGLVVLTLDLRPHVKFDFSNQIGIKFLLWVHKSLDMHDCMEFSEFYTIDQKVNPPYLDTATYDVMSNFICTPQDLHMDYTKAWSNLSLVPKVLSDGKFTQEYKDVFQNLMEMTVSAVTNYYNNQSRDLYTTLETLKG